MNSSIVLAHSLTSSKAATVVRVFDPGRLPCGRDQAPARRRFRGSPGPRRHAGGRRGHGRGPLVPDTRLRRRSGREPAGRRRSRHLDQPAGPGATPGTRHPQARRACRLRPPRPPGGLGPRTALTGQGDGAGPLRQRRRHRRAGRGQRSGSRPGQSIPRACETSRIRTPVPSSPRRSPKWTNSGRPTAWRRRPGRTVRGW